MKADDKQILGTHYKEMSIQPWTYVHANNLGYFEGSAIKYITRWRNKGGIADIQKAIHFLEKLIELESPSINNRVIGASMAAQSQASMAAQSQSTHYLGGLGDAYQKSHPSGYTDNSNLDWIALNEALRQWHGKE